MIKIIIPTPIITITIHNKTGKKQVKVISNIIFPISTKFSHQLLILLLPTLTY